MTAPLLPKYQPFQNISYARPVQVLDKGEYHTEYFWVSGFRNTQTIRSPPVSPYFPKLFKCYNGEKDILRLNISMHEAIAMHELHCLTNLLNHIWNLLNIWLLIILNLIFQIFVQCSISAVFAYEIYIFTVVELAIEFCDAFVFEKIVCFQFTSYDMDQVLLFNQRFIDYFQGTQEIRLLLHDQEYFTIATLSYFSDNNKIINGPFSRLLRILMLLYF